MGGVNITDIADAVAAAVAMIALDTTINALHVYHWCKDSARKNTPTPSESAQDKTKGLCFHNGRSAVRTDHTRQKQQLNHNYSGGLGSGG